MSQDRFEIEPEPRSWNLLPHWDWVFMISLGWLLFELFAQPAIGVLVASLRFGWPDIQNALWLLKRDPDQARSRVCAAFSLAYGFARTSVLTAGLLLLAMLVAIFMEGLLPGGVGQNPFDRAALLTAGWVIGICFMMTALVSLAGLWLAWNSDRRVWMGRGLTDFRRNDRWPPHPAAPNEAGCMMMLAIIIAVIPLFVITVRVLGDILPRRPGVILYSIGAVFLALLLVSLNRFVKTRLTAAGPLDCWAPELAIAINRQGGLENPEDSNDEDDVTEYEDNLFDDDSEDTP